MYITAYVPTQGGIAKQFAFYVAYSTSFATHPPKKNWMVAADFEGCGVSPGPDIIRDYDIMGDKVISHQIQDQGRSHGVYAKVCPVCLDEEFEVIRYMMF